MFERGSRLKSRKAVVALAVMALATTGVVAVGMGTASAKAPAPVGCAKGAAGDKFFQMEDGSPAYYPDYPGPKVRCEGGQVEAARTRVSRQPNIITAERRTEDPPPVRTDPVRTVAATQEVAPPVPQVQTRKGLSGLSGKILHGTATVGVNATGTGVVGGGDVPPPAPRATEEGGVPLPTFDSPAPQAAVGGSCGRIGITATAPAGSPSPRLICSTDKTWIYG